MYFLSDRKSVREPASFWREYAVAVVILLRVLATVVTEASYRVLQDLSLCDRERAQPPTFPVTKV